MTVLDKGVKHLLVHSQGLYV